MTRDEQLIKAALDMAAETCEKSAYAADADGHHFAYSIRAIAPAEVLAKVEAVEADVIQMTYRNYRGEVSRRTISPISIWFGTTDWHPEPGWLLSGIDMDKGERRDFALADCQFVDLSPAPDAVARLLVALRDMTDFALGKMDDPSRADEMRLFIEARAALAAMETSHD